MRFEVFIPATGSEGFDVTLRVEAKNWMQALKLGLQRTYSEESPVRNLFCDIKADDRVHVTDLASRRVFKIRRLIRDEPPLSSGDSSEPTVPDATADAPSRFRHPREHPAVDARRPLRAPGESQVPTLKSGELLGITDAVGRFRAISGRSVVAGGPESAETASVVEESVLPTQRMRALAIGGEPPEEEPLAETTLEAVFLEVADLFDTPRKLEDAVHFVLDLALRHISAESGSVLFANDAGTDLYFAAARGPKSDELLAGAFVVPIERGLVGFCTRTGVSLAVSDVEQDPRFFRDIADDLGYAARSILCAPIQHEGRSFGAVELLNCGDGAAFSAGQSNALSYIGGELGRFIAESLS